MQTQAQTDQNGSMSKRIRLAGRSIFNAGIVFGIISGLALAFSGQPGAKTISKVVVGLFLLLCFYWIFMGYKLMKNRDDIQASKNRIDQVTIVSTILAVIAVATVPLRGKLGVGDISIVVAAYFFYVKAKLK